jgi:hypothetical protein
MDFRKTDLITHKEPGFYSEDVSYHERIARLEITLLVPEEMRFIIIACTSPSIEKSKRVIERVIFFSSHTRGDKNLQLSASLLQPG